MLMFHGRQFRMKALVVCACVALSVGSAVPAASQTSAGGIIGVVTDNTGGTLPGVTVTATGPALQVPSLVVTTDERGEYRISPLPVGVYTVAYELQGFQTVRREGVRLAVGFTAKLDQELGVGGLQETVTVSGASPVVDVTNTATATEISSEALEILPTNRDGLKAFLAQVPGVRTNLDVGASSMTDTIVFRSYGQSGGSWQMLEGVMFASPSGSANGSHLDFNAIESSRIQTVASSAEMPRRGMLLDAVLKSGGNEFHGDAVAYGSSGNFESSNVNDELAAQGVRGVAKLHKLWDYSAALGGRIVRNKLWFFGALRYQGYDRDILNAFYDDGTAMQVNTNMRYHSEKVTYQMTEGNKLAGFYHWADEFQRRGGGPFRPADTREVYKGPIAMSKLEWQRVGGNSLVTSLQFGTWVQHGQYYAQPVYDNPDHPGKVATIDTFTQLTSGDWTSDGRREDRARYHSKGSLTYYRSDLFKGNHEFKAGFDFLQSSLNIRNLSRVGGNYQLRFNNGVPFEINTYNYPTNPKNSDHYLGIYVHDGWTIGRRVTLNLGLRYARDNTFAPEQCREAGDFAAAQCWDEIQMNVWSSFAPRLHFAWDIGGDGKSVLKGGWGRFDTLREIQPDLTNSNRNFGTTSTWVWRDLNNNRNYDVGEVNLDPNGPDFRAIAGTTDAIPNPDETGPKSDEFSLTLEREMFSRWALRATGIYARNSNLRRLSEIYRPYEAYNIPITNPDPGFDGVVGTADDPGRTVTYYDYAAALSGRNFAGTMLVNVPGAQTYKTIEVAATRRISNGWQLSASYTATKSDVPFVDGQALNPNTEINTVDKTWETTAKIAAGYTFPFEIITSVDYQNRSGTRQARQVQFTGGQTIRSLVVNVDPVGSISLPSANLVNARLAKRFALGRQHSIEARVDFFNILNANFVTSRNVRAGSTYLLPAAIIPPRIVQMGLSYKF